MSRRLNVVAQQAMCVCGPLHKIRLAVGYWQLSTQEQHHAAHTGSIKCISSGFFSAGIISHPGKTSPLSYWIPKTKSHFSLSQDAAGNDNPAGKHFGKLDSLASGSENTVESLRNLGFTEIEVQQLLNLNPRMAAQVPMEVLPVLSVLQSLGLNTSSIMKVLERCPELLGAKQHQLQSRVDNLRKHGLGEGKLQRVFVHCPQILNLSAKQVNNTVRFFKDKCIFTAQQVTEILQTSPNVLFEKFEELEYKFQFAYFRMGIKQAVIVKSGIFRVSLEELKQRLIFLERLGRYQTPDKKGQTQIINPKPKDIITANEDYFLAQVAMSSQEEFDTFKKLLKREDEDEGTSEELSDSDEELFPEK
ncbi:transcription termination factor 4, mitochondrial [Narcine bancroftii]|uniref:transcription termination factor 4, mitochondrial n=1 Tax=Narcine bancroftii TaxID=1343680 RepID=UPI003831C4E5